MAQQWLFLNDPLFQQSAQSGYYDEGGWVSTDPYAGFLDSATSPETWKPYLQALGYTGPLYQEVGYSSGEGGGPIFGPSAEFLNFVSKKIAEGYGPVIDSATKDARTKTFGFRLPSGEVINQAREKVSGFGDFFKEFVLPSVGAYFGAGALGNALSPLTNALTGAGAAGGGAGAAMGAGIAEGMAPGALAPASAAELGAVNALTGAAPAVGAAAPAMTGAGTPAGALASGAQAAGAVARAGTPAASPTGIDLLDKAINFVTTPAGSAIVSGVGNVVGGIAAGEAAKEAAQTQAASADKALELQRDIYNKFMEMNKPYYEAGVNALGQITRGEVTAEPGYGFRLGEGMKALERLQASRGNLLSGGAMKAGQRFAQDLASEEYGKSFNRLANIAGIGQTAASQAGTAGQNYAGQAGELGMQGANALVSGRIGRTSAYTSGMQGAMGALQGYQNQQQQNEMLNRLLPYLQPYPQNRP